MTTPSREEAPELKACPFCGMPPRACPDTSYGSATVFCPDENGCQVQPMADAELKDGETLADAINRWNTRADLANREPSDPPSLQQAKRFEGGFMVFALKKGKNLSKRMAGIPLPWVRHETLEIAETEARRLNALNPASTFVVMQEVARVKMLAEGEQP